MPEKCRLKKLREEFGVTSVHLATVLDTYPSAILDMEKRTEKGVIKIDTLQRLVRALGGEIRISAVFPNHADVDLTPSKRTSTQRNRPGPKRGSGPPEAAAP